MDAPFGQPAPNSGTSEQNPAGNGQEFDYQRSYNELRPEFTRATQELSSANNRLSEYEQLFEALHDSDPEVQAAAMEALGLEMDTGSPAGGAGHEEFVDPLEQELRETRAIVDELRSARELEAREAEAASLVGMRDEYIGEAIGFIEQNLKQQFSQREEEALGNLAIAMEKDGVPDVQGAYQLLYGEQGVLETNRERWISSKTGAYGAPLGTSIPADQRPATKADRISYIDERMRAIDSQQ